MTFAAFDKLLSLMNRIAITTGALLLLLSATAFAQGSSLNSRSDDYAAGFRITPSGGELWFTTGQDAPNSRSRILKRVSCSPDGFGTPETIDEIAINSPANAGSKDEEIFLNGSPTFAGCNGNFGMFASNRTLDGRNYSNDLYMMTMQDGKWNVTRPVALNSPFWDDTPALSPDGSVVYFASDRQAPGTQRPDIFYATRQGSNWSVPEPVEAVNTNAAEESPFVGEDGYLYYSTNTDGRYNIWRIRLDPATWLPVGSPTRFNLPGVNQDDSDETHPVISPGGNWFLFSSNRGKNGRKDFDIHWVKMPDEDQEVVLDVRLRTQDATSGIATTVTVQNMATGDVSTERSAKDGSLLLRFPRTWGRDPGSDVGMHEVILSAASPSPEFVSSVDTIVFPTTCTGTLQHTLFLWDTGTYRTPDCTQEFPIYQVRFFVTGYWCPTSQRFRDYSPCASLFTEQTCVNPPCDDHRLYDYTVSQNPKYPDCIRYEEFASRGDEFAREVDSAFVLLREAMRSAFGIPCLSAAIREGKDVKVEVIGTTDPRAYKADCKYTGETVDFANSFVQVQDSTKPYFTTGTPMKALGAGGNQLLSDLRAYNTAVMLDSIWTESIPEYRSLKGKGQVSVYGYGEAVSKETETPYERQRSIRVRITLPEQKGQVIAGLIPDPGRRVVLCSSCKEEVLQEVAN